MRLIFTIIYFFILSIGITGQTNYFAGLNAGASNTSGNFNTFVGYSAGQENTTGTINSFFGSAAGQSNIGGGGNTAVGFSSGANNTAGDSNNFFGDSAGFLNSTGSKNCFYGFFAGFQNTTGSNNVVIGTGAGPSSANATQSNRLYIDVVASGIQGDDDPLIYGEFDTEFVKINGTFEVTAGLANPSDINLKNNFEFVEPDIILDRISQLSIKKWTYKDRQDEVHIGPTAQDFYEKFGLGAGDKTISTIDSDGVALLAIQALKEKNDKLQHELSELKSIISVLIEKIDN